MRGNAEDAAMPAYDDSGSNDDEMLMVGNPFAALIRHPCPHAPAIIFNSKWEAAFRLEVSEFNNSGSADDFVD